MSSLVDQTNNFLCSAFDLFFRAFSFLSPVASLALLSILAGVVLVLLYSAAINQTKLRAVKREASALFLETLMFRRELGVSLRAQVKLFWHGVLYLVRVIPGLILVAVPALLILAQLNLWFDLRPLVPNERMLVRVKVEKPEALYNVKLQADPGISVETGPLRIEDTGEVYWRIKALEPGRHKISIHGAEIPMAVTQAVAVVESKTQGLFPLPTLRFKSSALGLLYPGANSIAESTPLNEVQLRYPETTFTFLSFETHWLFVFTLLSLLSGLLVAKIFGLSI